MIYLLFSVKTGFCGEKLNPAATIFCILQCYNQVFSTLPHRIFGRSWSSSPFGESPVSCILCCHLCGGKSLLSEVRSTSILVCQVLRPDETSISLASVSASQSPSDPKSSYNTSKTDVRSRNRGVDCLRFIYWGESVFPKAKVASPNYPGQPPSCPPPQNPELQTGEIENRDGATRQEILSVRK